MSTAPDKAVATIVPDAAARIDVITNSHSVVAIIIDKQASPAIYEALYAMAPSAARDQMTLARKWKVYAVIAEDAWADKYIGGHTPRPKPAVVFTPIPHE